MRKLTPTEIEAMLTVVLLSALAVARKEREVRTKQEAQTAKNFGPSDAKEGKN